MKLASIALSATGLTAITVLSSVVLHQQTEISRLRRDLAEKGLANAGSPVSIPASSLPVRSDPRQESPVSLPAHPKGDGTQPESAVPTRDKPAAAPGKSPEQDAQRRFLRQMRDLQDNPVMNELMTAQQRATLEVMYKGLVEKLHFTDEERKQFFDLLLDRQMQNAKLGMQLGAGQLSKEETQDLMKKSQAAQKATEDAIKFFLNSDEDFAAFQFYEATTGDRMALGGLRAQLKQQGTADLAAGVDEQLVKIMYEERKTYPFANGHQDQNTFDPAMFTEERIAQQIKDLRALNQRISERAGGLLTADQRKVFEASQESMLRMQESSLQMAAKMFHARESP